MNSSLTDMIAESIYRNYGKAIKEKGLESLTLLSSDAIKMISFLNESQIKEIYADFNIRFLRNEVKAWDKLGKQHMSSILNDMIKSRLRSMRFIT